MIPNDYIASEFKLPRLMLQATTRYRLVTGERGRLAKDGPGHHWRNQGAPTISHQPLFSPGHLTRVVGYGAYGGKPMPQPQPLTTEVATAVTSVNPASPAQVPDQNTTSGPLPQQPDDAPSAAVLPTSPSNRKRPAVDHLNRSTHSKSARATPPPPHAHPALSAPPEGPSPHPHSTVKPPLSQPSQTAATSNTDDDDDDLTITSSNLVASQAAQSTASAPVPTPAAPKDDDRNDDDFVITDSTRIPQPPTPSSNHPAPVLPNPPPTPPRQQQRQRQHPQPQQPHRFFRRASKTQLLKQRVKRLRGWCETLNLGTADQVRGWTKIECAAVLLDLGVEALMERKLGSRVSEIVSGEEEEDGLEVVRGCGGEGVD